jgi:cellulose synthase/poly-beta-1,6-N-acetylglucosamine synthase-like glycosyltransferase
MACKKSYFRNYEYENGKVEMLSGPFAGSCEYAFWGATGLILYTYAGYPIWIYLLGRWRPRPWRQKPMVPTVSIVMAVHNGEALLPQKLEHLLFLDYPSDRLELIIVSDGSTDRTNEILLTLQHPLVTPVICQEHRGKAAALNAGIACATGEILLFVDIRPWLEKDALRLLASNFADPCVGCATGQLAPHMGDHDAGAEAVGCLYWRYEQWIRIGESSLDSALGVYGGFYAIRRRLAVEMPEGLILDDMYQPLCIIERGYRSVVDVRARVYDTWPKTSRGEFSRKVRTLAGNLQLLQLAPWLLTRQNRLRVQLASHKLLRLVVPFLLILMFVTSTLLSRSATLYATLLMLQFGFYFLAGLGCGRGLPGLRRITGAANAFCMLNAAVVVGFYKFLFSREPLWKIWTSSSTPATRALKNASGTRTAS